MAFTTSADIQGQSYGYWKPGKTTQKFIPLGNAVEIDHIVDDIETKDARLLLSFNYIGERRCITINRSDINDPNKCLSILAGKGADVTRKHFDCFIDTLRIQEDNYVQNNICIEKVFNHLGWIPMPVLDDEGNQVGTKFCYRANRLIGGPKAHYTGPYSVTPMGSFDTWKDMVNKEIVGHTPLEIVLLAGLAAVVNGLIGPKTTGECAIVHVCGCSSSGKSTALFACASVSGEPYDGERRSYDPNGELTVKRSLYRNWSATEVATIRQCVGNKGAPIILNELGKFRGKDLTSLLYDLSDGAEKSRANSELKISSGENYSTVIVSSGELSILDLCKTQAEGLYNRVLEITDPLTTDANHSRRIKDMCRNHNGHAAPALAKHIIKNGGLDYVLPVYHRYCSSLPAQFPQHQSTPRFIEKFPALFLTTAEIATKALGIQFDLPGILEFFKKHEADHGADRNIARNSYDVILDSCRTNITSFYRSNEEAPRGKIYGRISYPGKLLPDGRYVAEEYELRKDFLEATLKSKGFPNISTCAKEWKAMGVLNHESGRLTRARKIIPFTHTTEDVYVFRVFCDPPAPKKKLTSKVAKQPPVHQPLTRPSPQMATLLNDDDKEGFEND